MKKLSISKATGSLAEFARDLNGDVLVVTEDGKPMAALLPIRDVDMETLSVGTNSKFLDLIELARRRHKEEGGISQRELRQRLGIPQPSKGSATATRTKSVRKQATKSGS